MPHAPGRMQLSFLVAQALLEGNFASYFASLPSADVQPKPIVVRKGRFECVNRTGGEERGTVAVAVLVVREAAAAAESDAQACERWVRSYGWEPVDMGYNPGFAGMAQMRGKVRRWLSWPGGGSLVLPDDPEVEHRDAILVGASD